MMMSCSLSNTEMQNRNKEQRTLAKCEVSNVCKMVQLSMLRIPVYRFEFALEHDSEYVNAKTMVVKPLQRNLANCGRGRVKK